MLGDEVMLPFEFEASSYRANYSDLAGLSDTDLQAHYIQFGRSEGRISNCLASREDFIRVIDPKLVALEIGPFNNPLLIGNGVVYCDVLDQKGLQNRAKQYGLNVDRTPDIKYVLSDKGLDAIHDCFDVVLSSHCIEHQTDLITHLKQIERLISSRKGKYFLLVPDKRYCFDRNIAESTVAEVIDAFESRRVRHPLRSVIEHRALTIHNDSLTHWQSRTNTSVVPAPVSPDAIRAAIHEWREANGKYVDVHAWYFTPDSFRQIVILLNQLDYLSLTIEELYPTRYGSNEFWAVLKS
jgi:SAM-dependent methyltransferase